LPPAPRRRPSPAARLGLAALWIALAAGPAGAATFTVNTSLDTDDGVCDVDDCTLREAITAANSNSASSNVIDFDLERLAANSTITLQSPLPLDVTKALLIDGTTATNLTVRGDDIGALFQFSADTTVADVILRDGQLAVADDIRLQLDVSADQTLSGVIADASAPVGTGGQLEKLGAATLVLLGANTYSGGTTVTAGTLQGNTTSLQGVIDLAADTLLVFDQGADGTFGGSVTGSGHVEKTGGFQSSCISPSFANDPETYPGCYGTLTIDPSVDELGLQHSGGTTITEGVIRLTNTADLTGDVTVDTLGALAFDLEAGGTFDGDIGGSGSVAKFRSRTLTLEGNNSYTGGTFIFDGELRGDTQALQGDVSFVAPDTARPDLGGCDGPADCRLVFTQTGSGTFIGDITGEGSVKVEFGDPDTTSAVDGVLTLVGANMYTGPTDLILRPGASDQTKGTLIGDTNSLHGSIDLSKDIETTLVFDQATDDNFGGSITGGLTDANVELGRVEKRGQGRLTVIGNQNYSGLTTVVEGRLDIDGRLVNSDVLVAASAVLGGTGQIDEMVEVNGTVAPGASIGTLTVGDATAITPAGAVVFNDRSFLEAEVNDSRDGDLLLINGTVDIVSGAQVLPLPEPGDYSNEVTARILHATLGSVDDREFTAVMSDLAFLDTRLIQFQPTTLDCDEKEVCLAVVDNRKTFKEFARTPNQKSVAGELDNATVTGGDFAEVYQNLRGLTVDEVPPTMDAIGGEPLTQFPTTRLAIASRFHRSIHARVRGLAWRNSETLFSGGAEAGALGLTTSLQLPAPPAPRVSPSALRSAFAFGSLGAGVSLAPDAWETGPGAWVDGYGIFGDLDGNANASDVDYTIAGTSLGIDGRLANHWVVGGAAGYARTIDLDFKQRDGSGDANTFQGALYAGRSTSRIYLSAAGRFAYSDMNTSRTIVFADIDRRATADFNGWDAGASVEGGVNLVEWWGVSVQPLASFDYVHVDTEGYTEKGADSLDLEVKSESLDSMVSGVGLRLHGTIAMDRDSWITPEVRVRWAHEFGDRDREIRGVLPAAATGGAWLVRGASAPADGLVVGASWTVTTAGNIYAFADYDAVLNQDLVEHSVAVGFRLEW